MSHGMGKRNAIRARVLDMHSKGVAPKEIAQAVGITAHQVYGYLGAHAARENAAMRNEGAAPLKESASDLLLRAANVPALQRLRECLIVKAERVIAKVNEEDLGVAEGQVAIANSLLAMSDAILARLIGYAETGDLG